MFLVSFSSKDSNPRGTSALALTKMALGLNEDARTRCTTYVAHLSSFGASSKLPLCASAFDSVDRGSPWWLMAANGISTELLRLIKAYYSSNKMKIRASGGN